MGKSVETSYASTRVFGMMYRLIEPAPEYKPIEEICIHTRFTSVTIPPMYLKAAGDMKHRVSFASLVMFIPVAHFSFRYDVELEGIMRQCVDSLFTS